MDKGVAGTELTVMLRGLLLPQLFSAATDNVPDVKGVGNNTVTEVVPCPEVT
jgi:hypothetical protein